ncbi:MAG: TolC family outer membrane protein [Acidiferrobacterales bacterium]
MARAENVLDVYRLALDNDPRFQAAQSTYRADLQKLPQARAALRPRIGAQADASRKDIEVTTGSGILSTPAGGTDFNSTAFELSLTQPIYNSSLFAGLRQARAEARRAEAQFVAAKQDLIVRVVEAYIAVLATLDNVEVAGAQKAANGRQREIVEGRLEVGLSTITDANQARARFELDVANEIEAVNLLRDAREGLVEITGTDIKDVATLNREAPLIEPDPPDIEKWVEIALKQNPNIIAALETAQIALEEIKRQRAGHYPTVDLFGSHTSTDDRGSITGPEVKTDRTEIGVQLTVPLYQGGLISSLTREAGHRYSAAQQDLESQRRSVKRTTRAAFLGVVGGASRVQATRQSVVASEITVQGRREGFEAGINTNVEVLDAQRDLFIARTDALRARYDYILELLRLKQSAGLLSEEDLIAFNRWLQ